ncbi:MAG: hypothetical protein NTX24_04940 [Candidatus Pacearchaeota archaeon]|nr:hypothetical protein [Candidatus Pacearchaeota archaeon]
MKNKILFLMIPLLLCSLLCLPSLCSAELWWNSTWHFRVSVNISSSGSISDAKTQVYLNFSELLSELSMNGSFSADSIRVMEYSSEQPHDWENESNVSGNLTWVANGTTPANTNRTFWVYFDVVENGAKQEGEIISENPHWRSGYTNNMDVWSNQSTPPGIGYEWNRTWAKMIEVSWKWSTEESYDFAYLNVSGLGVRTISGVGSENTSFLGSRILGGFTSDSSTIDSLTDGYGTYGCAIDSIKFYSVTNYTIPSLSISLGSLEIQNLHNYLELPPPSSFFEQEDIITLRGNVTDENSNLVTGVSVLFVIKNDTAEYLCSASENGTGKYECYWNSSGIPTGNYSILMNSSKEFFNSNSTLFSDRFTLESGPPLISITMENEIEQGSSVQINASVEDQSGTGIDWVGVNITRPDNETYQGNMSNVSGVWTIDYTNTSTRGIYLVVVYARDNYGKVGESNVTLRSHIRLNASLKTQAAFYSQGSKGRVEYSLKDTGNASVSNASVRFRIENPSGISIWDNENQTEITNQNGNIEPQPSFEIVSSDPVGNYTLFSYTTYWDGVSQSLVNRTDNYSFYVYASSTSFLTLDLESSPDVSGVGPLQVSATLFDGKNVNADSIRATLYDPLNNLIIDNVSMTLVETGMYSMNYTTSSSSTQGNWKWVVRATRGSNALAKQIFSHFVGGPFDVRNIAIIDNQVQDLEISVIVENKGAGQDVTVEWNLTRTDTGETLDSGADTFYVAGASSTVYTAYPSTPYVGEVKITFVAHYSGTEKAGAYSIFNTVEGGPTPPQIGGGGGGGGGAALKKLEIINFTKEVDVDRGGIGFLSFLVRNLGDAKVLNVSAAISGINEDWLTLPKTFDLGVNETKLISIQFLIPENAQIGSYDGIVIIGNLETNEQSEFVLKIFASKVELYLYKIQELKSRVIFIENKTLQSQLEGRDVSTVRLLLDNAREEIRTAGTNLYNRDYNEAANAISMASDYLDKAEYELQIAKMIVKSFFQQWWVISIIIFLAALVFIILFLKIFNKVFNKKLSITPVFLRKLVVEQLLVQKAENEKAKIRRMLALLEREYREGIISKDSYFELKNKNEEKLLDIEQKIMDLTSND